jgi:hypothetical protein
MATMAQDMQDRYLALDPEAQARTEEATDLSNSEWLAMGNKPSLALALGLIDADTAQALHGMHTDFQDMAVGERAVFIQTMAEVLGLIASA